MPCVSGEIDIVIDGAIAETVGAGGIVGELALVDDAPRAGAAVARSDAVVVPVARQRFIDLVERHPTFALQVMGVMADRLRGTPRSGPRPDLGPAACQPRPGLTSTAAWGRRRPRSVPLGRCRARIGSRRSAVPKNQVDSDKLTGTILAEGMVPADAPEDADLVVVNTCAFIEEARQESVDTVLALADARRTAPAWSSPAAWPSATATSSPMRSRRRCAHR